MWSNNLRSLDSSQVADRVANLCNSCEMLHTEGAFDETVTIVKKLFDKG